jgi:hypothetical protein
MEVVEWLGGDGWTEISPMQVDHEIPSIFNGLEWSSDMH